MKLEKLIKKVQLIIKQIENNQVNINQFIKDVHPDYVQSARNLCNYLILRSFDLRKIHDSLSDFGVSSLRTSESYTYYNLYNVLRNLQLLQNDDFLAVPSIDDINYKSAKKIIRKNANILFNNTQKNHFTEIMVTLPLEAADNKGIIKDMVLNGMEIARINLSHGTVEDWSKMVKYINEIKNETKQDIKIYMDLPGPKIRVGEIQIQSKKGNLKDFIPIKKGEHIILTKKKTFGRKSKFGKQNEQLVKAKISISIPEIIDDVNIKDIVLFDDGLIKCLVINKTKTDLELVVIEAFKTKIKSRKGINFPLTRLNTPALTQEDINIIPFVVKYADLVGYSFVRNKQDVKELYEQLKLNNADDLGVIFKIEHKEAFNNLAQILLEGMKRNKIGVMIARGDLAVEIGFERISEVQQQILWICEAAHIPVIWATQVLENLAKTGIPSRAEITDAAQSVNAECVMLNKGPFINLAIRTLKEILIKMETHSFKRKNALRPLNIANDFLKGNFFEIREKY